MFLVERMLAEVGLQDGLGLDDLAALAAVIGVLITMVGLFLRPVYNELREDLGWRKEFRRTWDGEPGTATRDPIPGVAERLNRIDGELKRNSGSTLKDAVFETKRLVEENGAAVQILNDKVDAVSGEQAQNRAEREAIMISGDQNLTTIAAAFTRAGIEVPAIIHMQDIINTQKEKDS